MDTLVLEEFQDSFKGFCNEKPFSTESRIFDIDKIALRAAALFLYLFELRLWSPVT